jgi:hypothetical protein
MLSVTYVAPGEYSYSEALTLGLETPPTPAELGLPECPDDSEATGFPTAEAAEEAAEAAPEEPVCAMDPSDTAIGIGGEPSQVFEEAQLTTGYHHNGGQTTGLFEGGEAIIEVANPDVTHTGGGNEDWEHVLGRVISKRPGTGKFLEVGWAERFDWPNRPYVFSYKEGDTDAPKTNGWNRHSYYNIEAGQFIKVRVRDCPVGACADFFWVRGDQASWETVRRHHSMHCKDPGSGLNWCRNEFFMEVFSRQEGSPHPAMNTTDGVNFRTIKLRTQPNTWVLWDGSTFGAFDTFGDEPYDVCWIQEWWAFRAGKGIGDPCS